MIKDIYSWCAKKRLSESTIKEIERIRNSDPSRRVRSNFKNVSGFYPSKKMGFTIQFESKTVELAAIYEMEHNPSVLEYYDQPPQIKLKYEVNGKKRGNMYTPDFFVISEDWIGWEEWKTEEDLIKISAKQPYKYCLNEEGQWICPPGEEYAKERNLSFRVRLSKEINWTHQNNIHFLEDYLLYENLRVSDQATSSLKNRVESNPGINLNELLENQENYSTDDIYTLIATEELYIDLYDKSITEPDLVKIYIDKQIAQAYKNIFQSQKEERFESSIIKMEVGNKVHWDGREWTIINMGETKFSLLKEDGSLIEIPMKSFKDFVTNGKIKGIEESVNEVEQEAFEILKMADEDDLREANKRYGYICQVLNGQPMNSIPVSGRSLRRWLQYYKESEEVYGNGFVGLLPKNKQKGNRNRRIEQETIDLMREYINNEYLTNTQKSMTTVFNMFHEECKVKGYACPSFKTFSKEVTKYTAYEQSLKRKGRKAAYKEERFYWYLDQTTPRHGTRPFEIVHMDHTELDVELVCSTTGKVLGRPWVTFMVDAYSRRILAVYLTFDEPSYRSNMMTLRECVKRHNRLPKILVVDGGKEFHSTYFETLLAFYNVQKQVRPPSKARFGSVVERLFGTTNKMFIHNLKGNTQIMKNVRQVSKEVNPKNHAVWTLPLLAEYLFKFVYEIYDEMEHSTLGESPSGVFSKGIALTGERKFTLIGYDNTFTILTLPSTKKGTAKVQPGKGIKINRFYYWSDALYNPDIEGKQVKVRYDPYNLSVAYAYIKNRWVQLLSEYHTVLEHRTEKEIQIVFEEIKKRQQVQGQIKTVTSKKLVDFLTSAQNVEKLQTQRLKDNESRSVLTVIEGGKIEEKKSSSNSKKSIYKKDSKKQTDRKNDVKKERIIFGEF